MARPEKVAVVERVRDQFTETGGALFTDYRGLTVAEMAELRAELRKVGATAHVAKNKLVRRAAVEAGFEGLDEICSPKTILATNTSSFTVDDVAGATARADRVVGLH